MSLVDFLMDIVAPTRAISLGAFLHLVTFLLAICRAPWHQLRIPQQLHVFLGSIASLLLLWNIRTHLGLNTEFHFLGTTAVTLVLGWPLAVIAASIAQFGLALSAGTSLNDYSVAIVANGIIPIMVTEIIRRHVLSKLPAHFFIYVFVGAFLAGGLAMAISRLALVAHALVTDAATGSSAVLLPLSYLPLSYLPLIAFPEALINGMLVTLLVTYRPQWVATFDDTCYLQRK